MKKKIFRTVVEMGFIIFLFYSNLLMGEFTNSEKVNKHGIIWAIRDIFTVYNFFIAVMLAFVGQTVFGFLRKKIGD